MKQRYKNDTSLAEVMWWSLILSGGSFIGGFRMGIKDYRAYFMASSAVFLAVFFVYMAKRKKNRLSIQHIKESGTRVTGIVEDIIQKNIALKYTLKVTFPVPGTADTVTAFTPLLHKDPRHYTTVGSSVFVYVNPDDYKDFYIDITDE